MSLRRLLLLSLLCSIVASNVWAEAPAPRLWCYECDTGTHPQTGMRTAACVREVPGQTGSSTCNVVSAYDSQGRETQSCFLGGVSCIQSHYPGDPDGCQGPAPPGSGGGPPFETSIRPGEPEVTRSGQPVGGGR